MGFVLFHKYKWMFGFLVFFGTAISVSSPSWMLIWVGLEINLIGFTPLIICSGSTGYSEAGIKYFIIQSMGSALVLISVLLCELGVWWQSIILNELFSGDKIMCYFKMIGMFMLGIGLLLKVGSFPFYSWVPQVVVGIDCWFLCFILLTWQKLAPLSIIVYMFESFKVDSVVYFFILMGVLSSLVGGICGVGESNINSLLAYSSVGHTGWLVFSCNQGFSVMLSYFFVYFSVSMVIFMVLWSLGSTSMVSLFDLNKYGVVFWMFFICVLSLGGVPPFFGFYGKWLIISESVKMGMWVEVSFLLIGSLFSIFYYLKLGILILMNKSNVLGHELKGKLLKSSFFFTSALTFFFMINLFGIFICYMYL